MTWRRPSSSSSKGSAKDLLPPFPPETRVRQIFVTKDGTAYVDFTKEVTENFAYGSSSEMAAVYALVNTLALQLQDRQEGLPPHRRRGAGDPGRPRRPEPAPIPQYSLIAK